ncbi:short-chain dehydrogenase [Peribacillus cavernae]|uniref:Short-chain dehydrogenase n=1 Tax=Peribacillus cavernae TaxID=1674310 RepID=A0A3S0U6B5_9BACI|nr:short-chain dehydrogenase [Peribacillus cavernae]
MKHALVVGGTGMLTNVSLWLMNNGYHVTVIGQSPDRMKHLLKKIKNDALITPILVDYKNGNELKKKMEFIIRKNGDIHLIIAWIHSDAENALDIISQQNSKNNNKWTLLHILGSSSNLIETKRNAKIPDHCLYRQVQLGFIIEGGYSRWLTNEEISNGVIESIINDKLLSIVGVTQPWEKRP